MKLYEYWLGLYPLDWEFCFMPVQTYKNFITEQYHKNPTFYNISAGSIEKVLAHIDVILSAAMEDWNNTTNHAALRCPPMIFPLPKGQDSISLNFEEEQEDEDSELEDEASCVYWEEATPILKQVAAVAYRTAKSELNVDTEAFEVSYNGPEDWYYPLEK